MRRALVLVALALTACTTEPSSPTPDDAGDGDGDMGDGDASGDGDGDGDEQPADLPAAMLDLPADGIAGCCLCSPPATCEADIAGSESPAACEVYGEQWSSDWEWHADCYYDEGNLRCPGSCAD